MHPLEKETLKIITHNSLLPIGSRVVIGVSAGIDSMALLHVLAALTDTLRFSLIAVYVNHALRPKEAAQEAELVQQQAELLAIPCHIGTVNVAELARRQKLSIEQAARTLRYEYLTEVAAAADNARIAVAQTSDDQAEEVLLRLIRGSGCRGLSGMNMINSRQKAGAQTKTIRPFLTIAKERLYCYLQDKKIPFLEDSSNQTRIYLRNRVRIDLIPWLAKHFNPNIKETLQQTADILTAEDQLLAELAGQAIDEIIIPVVDNNKVAAGTTPVSLTIMIDQLKTKPKAIKRRVVEKACWLMESAPSFRKIEQIIALASDNTKGSLIHLAQGLRVQKKRGHLLFFYPQGKTSQRGNLID